jgi:Domain of unknown function (DUF4282)
MSNDPGNPGDQPPPGQGWGAPQQPPPYPPGGYGQEPPPGWGGYPPPGPPGPPPGPAGYGGPPMGPGPQGESKGFFAALFDFSFDSFATPAVVKVLYIIGMVLLGLFWVGAVIFGFTRGAGQGLLILIVGGIGALFYLTLFRITLEFYYAIVRMSEDIHHRR